MPGSPRVRPSAAVAAAGLDHARLVYHYLDAGDGDGLGSLFADNVEVRRPGAPPVRGRTAIECAAHPRGQHVVHGMFAAEGRVVVTGRFVGEVDAGIDVDVEFADIFTVSGHGLLTSQARYFFTTPR